jgi:hypothetical protein
VHVERRLRIAVPMLPLLVLILILLFIEDPKKPWSGIAYVAGLLAVVGVGWAIGRWVVLVVPAVVFAVALVVSERESAPAGTCDPACWSTADGLGVLAFAFGSLLAIGLVLRHVMAWLMARDA